MTSIGWHFLLVVKSGNQKPGKNRHQHLADNICRSKWANSIHSLSSVPITHLRKQARRSRITVEFYCFDKNSMGACSRMDSHGHAGIHTHTPLPPLENSLYLPEFLQLSQGYCRHKLLNKKPELKHQGKQRRLVESKGGSRD